MLGPVEVAPSPVPTAPAGATVSEAVVELPSEQANFSCNVWGGVPAGTVKSSVKPFPFLVRFSLGPPNAGVSTVALFVAAPLAQIKPIDTDTIVASARAYVHALNKLLVKRVRTEPQALSA